MLILRIGARNYRFDLKQTRRIELGRHEVAHVRLDDEDVSVHHAELLAEEGDLVLRDLGSTNGTLLNGEHVRQGVVRNGDRIDIGSNTILVNRESQGTNGYPASNDDSSLEARP